MKELIVTAKKYISLPRTLLIGVIGIGAYFRLYNVPQRFGFDYDATRDALIAIHGAQNFIFPLHGPPSALGDFYFGPWYYYQLIVSTLVFPFQYSAWYSVIAFSLFGIVCMYLLGEKMKDWRLGIILAGITAVSTSLVIAGTGLSNPKMIFPMTACSLWLFVKIIKDKHSLLTNIFFGFIVGVAINYHYQALTLLVLFPTALFFVKRKLLYVIQAGIGIVISFIPLIMYEFMHSGRISQGLFFYFTQGKNAVYIPNSWTIYLKDFWPSFWSETFGIPLWLGLVVGILVVCTLGVSCIQKKLSKELLVLILIFCIQFLYLRYYTGEREIYYLYFIQPLLVVFLGYSLWILLEYRLGKFFVAVISIILLYFIIPNTLDHSFTPKSHRLYIHDIELLKREYPDKKFAVYDCGTKEKNNSQAFAFLLHHHKLLDANGTAVLFVDDTCVFDSNRFTFTNELVVEADVDTHKKKIYVEEKYSTDTITTGGWTHISPESVYDREL